MTGYLTTHIVLDIEDKEEAEISKRFLTKLYETIDKVGASETEENAIGSVIGIIEQILDGGSF